MWALVPLLTVNFLDVIANEVIMDKNIDFKVSEDYIFSVYPNEPERYLNPNFLIITRNITFLQIDTSINALGQLVTTLGKTCEEVKSVEDEGSMNYEYEIIHGKFNLSSAQAKCGKIGKRLVELQTSDQLLVLLQRLNGKYTTSPAGTFFLQNISNFAFESNGSPFKYGAVNTAVFGNTLLARYESYMYKNYYLRYIFNGTKALYEITPLSTVNDQIICMYKEVKPEDSLASSCRKDLLILKNKYWNIKTTVKSYTDAINRLARFPIKNNRRKPRGLLTALTVGAAVGGGAAGVIPTLFSNYMNIRELKEASERTEQILGHLDSRTNLLDVNQINLNSAIQKASKIIRLGVFKDNIQSVKIHANSISIFVGKRIDILQQLTGRPKSTRSYLLSMSLPEIKRVIKFSFPRVRSSDIKDPNILYSFQAVKGGQLFLILKVLLPNELKIHYFVRSLRWPKISNKTLVARGHNEMEWFMLLSQEKYVESTSDFIDGCRSYADRCTTDLIPKTIISGRVPPFISQYFKIAKDAGTDVTVDSKLFLVNIGGSYLAYTSILPVEIRITCFNKKPQVSSLIGRGLLHITKGCKVSSPYFTVLSPQQLGSLNYQSQPIIGDTYYSNIHVWNTSRVDFSVTLSPIPKIKKVFDFERDSQFRFPSQLSFMIAIIFAMFCIIILCFIAFACKRCSYHRSIETNV